MMELFRRHLIVPALVLGLSAVFIVLCLILFFCRGNDAILRKKLRIGGLILALQGAAVQGAWASGGRECYARVPYQALTVVSFVPNRAYQAYSQANQEYTAKTAVIIERQEWPYAEYYTRVLVSAVGGNPPDVAMFHSGPPQWGLAEHLLPLDKYVSEWRNAIPEDVWVWHRKDANPANPLQMVPVTRQGVGIYYNRANLAKAGLDPDKDYKGRDEFVAACEALKRAGITPIVCAIPTTADYALRLLWGSILGSDVRTLFRPGQAGFRDPRIRTGVEYLLQMKERGYFGEGALSNDYFGDASRSFSQGVGGFFIGLLSDRANWREFSDGLGPENCGYFPNWVLPESAVQDAQVVSSGGTGYSIMRAARYPEAAAQYIKMWAVGDGARMLLMAGALPASAPLHVAAIAASCPAAVEVIASVASGPVVPPFTDYLPSDPGIRQSIGRHIQLLLNGEIDAQGFTEAIQATLEEHFAQHAQDESAPDQPPQKRRK